MKKILLCLIAVCALQAPLSSAEIKKHDPITWMAIQKCGTHLLGRTLSLIRGGGDFETGEKGFHNIVLPTFDPAHKHWWAKEEFIRINAPHTAALEQYLSDNSRKIVFIYRDPRDALLSCTHYMDKFRGERRRDFIRVSPEFDSLSFDEKVESLMTGSHSDDYIEHWYKTRILWKNASNTLPVKYEDLVGSSKGGDDAIQRQTIQQIADFFNINLTEAEVDRVVECFWPAKSEEHIYHNVLRNGSIGSWKQELSEENKTLFKAKYGVELIELGYESDGNW